MNTLICQALNCGTELDGRPDIEFEYVHSENLGVFNTYLLRSKNENDVVADADAVDDLVCVRYSVTRMEAVLCSSTRILICMFAQRTQHTHMCTAEQTHSELLYVCSSNGYGRRP